MQTKTAQTIQQDENASVNARRFSAPLRLHLSSPLDWVSLLVLALAAFLPRLLLAQKLDVVTDETVYILGGKVYFHLLTHLSLRSPGWDYNYEHPALVKLLLGLLVRLNALVGRPLPELLAARLLSIFSGTLLSVALYMLGKAPFGRAVAFCAALCLAFSPWLTYFSALAYLDMPMTLLLSLAYLLLWHALRRPWLYPVSALCLALATACKYTAILALPGLLAFLLLTFVPPILRERHLRASLRPLPWRWWLLSGIVLLCTFFAANPALWRSPMALLWRSLDYQLHHASEGHLTFIAGQPYLHAPAWTILLITFSKLSLFVTIPAVLFVFLSLGSLLFFPPKKSVSPSSVPTPSALLLLLCWLAGIFGTFGWLVIVVGTHYHLPVAPPIALAAACTLLTCTRALYRRYMRTNIVRYALQPLPPYQRRVLTRTLLLTPGLLALTLPHLLGLLTVQHAEGYTSELFQGENRILQVAYPGYRDGVLWLSEHTRKPARIGLVALVNTLNQGEQGVSWYNYNADLRGRFHFFEVHPDDPTFAVDFLLWPEHLIQRGYTIPPAWRSYTLTTISGGSTTYCYILARSPVSIFQ